MVYDLITERCFVQQVLAQNIFSEIYLTNTAKVNSVLFCLEMVVYLNFYFITKRVSILFKSIEIE